MGPEAIAGKNTELIAKALDFMALRHKVIAGNIANADTPNYKAFDLVLAGALGSEPGTLGGLIRPASSLAGTREADSMRARVVFEKPLSNSLDGNTVDVDKEMTKLVQNNLTYNASVQALTRLYTILKFAIEEGGMR